MTQPARTPCHFNGEVVKIKILDTSPVLNNPMKFHTHQFTDLIAFSTIASSNYPNEILVHFCFTEYDYQPEFFVPLGWVKEATAEFFVYMEGFAAFISDMFTTEQSITQALLEKYEYQSNSGALQ